MHVDDLAHAVSVVFCRSALSDFDLTPGSMHVEEDEQVGRSIALILAVETFELAWSGRDRLAHLTDELCRTLVETDHRALRIRCHSFKSNRQKECAQMPGKTARSTLDQAFGLPEVLVAVSTSRPSCKRAGKTRTLMPVWDSSGESRIDRMDSRIGNNQIQLPASMFAAPQQVLISMPSPLSPG